jgi:hypothetical protein
MKRLKKFTVNPDSYLATDIDPLLDELQQLRNAEPFPTLEEFKEWHAHSNPSRRTYNYFAKFKTRTIEVFPEVGKEYEIPIKNGAYKAIFNGFEILTNNGNFSEIVTHIRPIATPTRDEVIAKAKELGLTQAELEVLCTK